MLYSMPSLNLPKVVPSNPDEFYKIPIKGKIYSDEMGEYGESIVIGEFKGLCNYQETARRVFSSTGVISKVIGTCEFNYDILKHVSNGTDVSNRTVPNETLQFLEKDVIL